MKELNKLEFGRKVGSKRYKEGKKLEREMKRITQFADARAVKYVLFKSDEFVHVIKNSWVA